MTFYGICAQCGKPVEHPAQPAFEVRGWELLRAGGGANQIKHRSRVPGRVVHNVCLDELLRSERGAGKQEGLFSS